MYIYNTLGYNQHSIFALVLIAERKMSLVMIFSVNIFANTVDNKKIILINLL